MGPHLNVTGVVFLVDTHHEHRSISRGGRDDDLQQAMETVDKRQIVHVATRWLPHEPPISGPN